MRVCFSCREQIDGPAIESEGNHYHLDHFCCNRCKQPLGGVFHKFKVWRLCSGCLPRPVCASNQCSEPDRRIGQGSGGFYRLPADKRLEAFHGSHSVRCSVCGRAIFCSGAPADALAYHLSQGRPTCTRCYYHVDPFNRWQMIPGSGRGRSGTRKGGGGPRHKPPLPDEFLAAAGRRAKDDPEAGQTAQATRPGPRKVKTAKEPPQSPRKPLPGTPRKLPMKAKSKKAPPTGDRKKPPDGRTNKKGAKSPPAPAGKSPSPSPSQKQPPPQSDKTPKPSPSPKSPATKTKGSESKTKGSESKTKGSESKTKGSESKTKGSESKSKSPTDKKKRRKKKK